ncbi:sigma-54 dependent transcriptional regulator [uncultured Fibrobacter sp.]|uniref:sigma-54 dependent transcriptional regulator n=1 Tax=uncultured Fibrobacter sp. TaxID=261512 RepID=UPI0026011AE2|nr:sigma-54 dependent transcriptional regulator [uncultured Fibrobacter sp.]
MKILIADLDKTFISDIQQSWSLADSELLVCYDREALMPLVKNESISLAFIEVPFLTLENMDMVSYLKEKNPGIEIFVLCDNKNWPGATSAINRGANSFLMKPVSIDQLESTAQKIQSQQQTKNTHQLMESQVLDSLLGDTPEMRKILKTVYKIAPTTSTVLITGESGSGKEFLANVVHRYSKRAAEPFIAVNCGAIPENLVESELFGAKKGSYTGSTSDKKGLFEAANGGTLFLDEVGELSAATQVKLLRFLQNHEIRRVGETEARYLDVRIIAATNRDLQQAMHAGTFREDLYYRLNTFHLQLPPLRERKPVIPTLIRYFILKYKEAHGKEILDLEPAAQYALTRYPYPGNIRELENIVEHAIVLSDDGIIRLENLPEDVQAEAREKQFAIPHMKGDTQSETVEVKSIGTEIPIEHAVKQPASTAPAASEQSDEIISLEEMERRHILHALSVCEGNRTEVCKRLGISRATLWRKLKELKIQMEGEET